MDAKEVEFGSINVETGEIQKGYIKNGKMKFRKYNLWEKFKLWLNSPKKVKIPEPEPEYLGGGHFQIQHPPSFVYGMPAYTSEEPAAFYRKKFSNNTYEYYALCNHKKILIDGNAFTKDQKVVLI